MSKTFTIILIIVVAVVFLATGVWLGLKVSGTMSAVGSIAPSPYSAVYLSTGDVYFGKLDWFPSPHLEDAWFLQRSTDASGNVTVSVYPLAKVAWGPTDVVYLNSQQIILWTRLASDSSVVQAMENPGAAPSAVLSPGDNIEPQDATSTSMIGSTTPTTSR